jgi:hypothetical protein
MHGLFEIRTAVCISWMFAISSTLFSQSTDTMLSFNENGKWGFINTQGKTIISCQFESVLYWGSARYGKVKKDGTWFFITRKGQKLPLPIDGVPESFNDSILVIRSSDGKHLITELGRNILSQNFTDIKQLENGYFSYYLGDSCGLAHIDKGIITAALFDKISFHGMQGFEVVSCEKTGFIDNDGKQILEPIYEPIGRNKNGFLKLSLGEAAKVGIYDTRNKEWLIECAWDILIDSNQCFIELEDERGSFIYNRKSGIVLPEVFDQVDLLDEIAIVDTERGKGIYNVDGGYILNPQFSSISKEYGTYLAQENGAWKLFSIHGKSLSRDSFFSILSLSAPAWVLERKDDWIVLDSSGNNLLSNMHSPEVLGNKVKYYDGSTMVSFMVDKKAKVVSKKSFDHVVRLQVNTYKYQSFESRQVGLDADLSEPNSLWFKDDKIKKWGLKHANGTILIAPVYDYVFNNKTYNCSYVYLKTQQRNVKLASSFYDVSARAGLVNNESGEIIIEPRFLDVFVTGSTQAPLFFGITDEFLFKRIIPSSEVVAPSYSWVDKSEKHPVRALLSSSKPKTTKEHIKMICTQLEMTQRINNPEFELNKTRFSNSERNVKLTFSDQKWVYLFPQSANTNGLYSEAEPFIHRLAIAKHYRSQMFGLLDSRGFEVLPFEYTKITRNVNFGDTLYYLSRADTTQFLFDSDKRIFSIDNQHEISAYDGTYIYIRQPHSLGFTVDEQKVRLFAEAWKMGKMSEGFIAIFANSKWKYYDENGIELSSRTFSKAYDFRNGKALVKERGKWRFIDNQGQTSEVLKWKNMKPVSGDGFVASDGQRWYITDKDGNPLHKESYPRVKPMINCDYVLVNNGSKWGLRSTSGKELTKTCYNSINYLGDDLFSMQKRKRVYLKHGDTKERKLKRYTHISNTAEGYFALRNKKGWHFADTSLNLLGKNVFRTIKPMHAGYFTGSVDRFACLIDSLGEIAFLTKNRLIGEYSNGFILSYNSSINKYCYLNARGGNVFANDYLKALPFKNKRAWVLTEDGWGCIDDSGEWIEKPIYYELKKMDNDAYVAKLGTVYGLCDAKGKMLLNPVYNEISIKDKRLLYAQRGNHVMWKYLSGNTIFESQQGKSLADNR